MEEKIPVNDGKGLMDNLGMIDSIIVDCNTLPRLLMDNKNVAFCAKIVEMVQKLSLLRDGVEHDVSELQKQLKELTGGEENV